MDVACNVHVSYNSNITVVCYIHKWEIITNVYATCNIVCRVVAFIGIDFTDRAERYRRGALCGHGYLVPGTTREDLG